VSAGALQVVILGAGLDSRAFRLPLAPGTCVYEIDTPGVLDFKQGVLMSRHLDPVVKRVPVGVDLRDDTLEDADERAVMQLFVSASQNGADAAGAARLAAHGWTGQSRSLPEELTRFSRPVTALFDQDRDDPFQIWLSRWRLES
jgi:Leucine carboxyl methyltransferase